MKNTIQIILSVILSALFLVAAPQVFAGTFKIVTLWATGLDTGEAYGVEINARARYFGTPDPGDNHYLIQTTGNSDTSPFGLDDWDHPDFLGAGKNGSGVFTNNTIECVGGCSATADWIKPYCSVFERWYKGRGAVTIFHLFNPKIDTKIGPAIEIPCQEPPDPPDPPGCESTTNTTAVLSLDDITGETRASSAPLRRRVDGAGDVSYLMPE